MRGPDQAWPGLAETRTGFIQTRAKHARIEARLGLEAIVAQNVKGPGWPALCLGFNQFTEIRQSSNRQSVARHRLRLRHGLQSASVTQATHLIIGSPGRAYSSIFRPTESPKPIHHRDPIPFGKQWNPRRSPLKLPSHIIGKAVKHNWALRPITRSDTAFLS